MTTKVHRTLTGETGAVFSPCERYRYKLWRTWDRELPTINFLMLNPSTATETATDPTVTRCLERAKAMQFGRLIVTNLFALRSTDPRGLRTCEGDPVGHEPGMNDQAILEVARESAIVVMAWGAHGNFTKRGRAVWSMLLGDGQNIDGKLRVLGWTKDGSCPLHPLMISYNTKLQHVNDVTATTHEST